MPGDWAEADTPVTTLGFRSVEWWFGRPRFLGRPSCTPPASLV